MLCGMTDETGEASGLEGGRDGGWGTVVGVEKVEGEVWRVEVAKKKMDKKVMGSGRGVDGTGGSETNESWSVLGTVSVDTHVCTSPLV